MVRVIVAKDKLDCEHLLGQFVDESHFDTVIEEDTDCYLPASCDITVKAACADKDCASCDDGKDEKRIAFKFRKNYFSKKEQEEAYRGLRKAAVQSQNRGLAAGPRGKKLQGREFVTEFQLRVLDMFMDAPDSDLFDGAAGQANLKADIERMEYEYSKIQAKRGLVWLSSKTKEDNFNFDKWLKGAMKATPTARKDAATKIYNKYISDTSYANQVFSGIAGWFDRYPRIPYGRATAYTQYHYDLFELAFPFLQSLNKGFKDLLPWRWNNQRRAADKIDPRFLVPGTVFSTITVNKTFRTACHRDAGDFSDGLSNLLVLSNDGRFTGGYLVFPEYRIAVNVRPGDLLLVNNHEIIHGNTPIVCEEGSERISLVCYLRENMLELGSYDYENFRYEFVESRRKNKEHPLWREGWNGVSENMWESREWYDYLETHGGREMLDKYHPEAYEEKTTLEAFF